MIMFIIIKINDDGFKKKNSQKNKKIIFLKIINLIYGNYYE